MSSRRNLVAVFPSHFRTGLASTHFVNLSTATRRWVKPEGALLKGPTMSIPHTADGQVMGIVLSAELGTWVWLAYFWHLMLLEICPRGNNKVGYYHIFILMINVYIPCIIVLTEN